MGVGYIECEWVKAKLAEATFSGRFVSGGTACWEFIFGDQSFDDPGDEDTLNQIVFNGLELGEATSPKGLVGVEWDSADSHDDLSEHCVIVDGEIIPLERLVLNFDRWQPRKKILHISGTASLEDDRECAFKAACAFEGVSESDGANSPPSQPVEDNMAAYTDALTVFAALADMAPPNGHNFRDYEHAMQAAVQIAPYDSQTVEYIKIGLGQQFCHRSAIEALAELGTYDALDLLGRVYDFIGNPPHKRDMEKLLAKVRRVHPDVEFQEMVIEIALCPECGRELPTTAALQCFGCGADWHDPDNVIHRRR